MTLAFVAVESNRQCLSIDKESVRFKQVVGRIWKIVQPFRNNALVGSIQNNINLNIEEILCRMCDVSDDFFKSDGDSDRPKVLDTNTYNTSNVSRDGSSKLAQLRAWRSDDEFAETVGSINKKNCGVSPGPIRNKWNNAVAEETKEFALVALMNAAPRIVVFIFGYRLVRSSRLCVVGKCVCPSVWQAQNWPIFWMIETQLLLTFQNVMRNSVDRYSSTHVSVKTFVCSSPTDRWSPVSSQDINNLKCRWMWQNWALCRIKITKKHPIRWHSADSCTVRQWGQTHSYRNWEYWGGGGGGEWLRWRRDVGGTFVGVIELKKKRVCGQLLVRLTCTILWQRLYGSDRMHNEVGSKNHRCDGGVRRRELSERSGWRRRGAAGWVEFEKWAKTLLSNAQNRFLQGKISQACCSIYLAVKLPFL